MPLLADQTQFLQLSEGREELRARGLPFGKTGEYSDVSIGQTQTGP
ncbi:hypothetical protein GCM10010307_06110 [Streptomyces vastus]|uniref:Uncharacterized protein n=1 Tax=Streptomyces vastus TaxID=285451 RepID=A0ABN3QBP1_9ACTN